MSEPTEHKGLLDAVRAVQLVVGTLPKDATNPHYASKYTPLDTIVETVGPLLAQHGLVWMTFPTTNGDGVPMLRYRLAHTTSGEQVEDTMPLLVTHVSPQGMGSALTYARRYSMCAVLNLVADDDDDGQAAKPKRSKRASSPPGTPEPEPGATDVQRKQIHALISEAGVSRAELADILGPLGVVLAEGWLDTLTPGASGSARVLIDLLTLRRDRVRASLEQQAGSRAGE